MKLPETESSVLVIVDIQERLVKAMSRFDEVLGRVKVLLGGAGLLNLDVIVTEQYPKGLGPTIPEVVELLPAGTPVLAKTSFSVFGDPGFKTALESRRRKTVILVGIEAHVCVLQSVYDALEAGYRVILAADAVTSRLDADATRALEAARAAGAEVLGVESILFMLLRDAKHPAFKGVSQLIR